MSVRFFDAEELGEVVAALPPSFDKARACALLASYSVANARAFERSYPNDGPCTPNTTAEIVRASCVHIDEALARWGTRRARAESTASLLIYNSIANDGTTHLSDTDRAAIIELEIAIVCAKR